jgi:hypothetical protein
LGMTEVPTVRLESLTEEQIRAYVLADNKLADNAGWDKSILAIELQNLLTIDSFDVTITGFEIPEIDIILGEATVPDKEDELPPASGPAVTQPGDLWQLGKHRIFCVTRWMSPPTSYKWARSAPRPCSPTRHTT